MTKEEIEALGHDALIKKYTDCVINTAINFKHNDLTYDLYIEIYNRMNKSKVVYMENNSGDIYL